jgi:hypothetical protein
MLTQKIDRALPGEISRSRIIVARLIALAEPMLRVRIDVEVNAQAFIAQR